jgi:tripartite-type tricarboxylate transporter receptor subunit TctC
LCVAAVLAVPATAATYPERTIRIVVPYTTGGGTDVMARVIAADLSKMLGQSVIVDNKPGAGGVIGTEIVSKAPPDGYTIGLISSGHAINPEMYTHMPFDPVKGVAPITQVATGPNVVVVNANVPAHSLGELIDLARREPGKLTFGSAGVGNPTHLAGELLQRAANIKLLHVPYKGSGQAEIALAGGEITMIIDSVPAALPFINAGKTRALAVTGKRRFPLLPDVPTAAEAGLPGYEFSTWWGMVAPPGTPPEIIATLNNALGKILRSDDVRKQFLQFGATPEPGSADAFGRFIESEVDRYTKLIKALGIQPLS